MKQIFFRPLNSVEDLRVIKCAAMAGDVQFHRLYPDECVDPYAGSSELHDQCTAAFNEIAELNREVRERADAIFAEHGLQGHGFTAYVATAYDMTADKHWDKS